MLQARHIGHARKRRHGAAALALIALAGCTTAPDGPVPIWLSQTSEGSPVVDKQVASWKALKFKDLVRQRTDFSCGAAVLATVFNKAFGYETSMENVDVSPVEAVALAYWNVKTSKRHPGRRAKAVAF